MSIAWIFWYGFKLLVVRNLSGFVCEILAENVSMDGTPRNHWLVK